MACQNNLRQIALAVHQYEDMQPKGTLPAGTVPNGSLPPEQRLSWLVELLPFVEEDALFKDIDRQVRWDDEKNLVATQKSLPKLRCPDWVREQSPDPVYTAYVGIAGLGADAASLPAGNPRAGVFGYDRQVKLADIKDGTANTLLIFESALDNGPWAQGGPATVRGLDPSCQPYLGTGRPFGGTHFNENTLLRRGQSIGANAAMADGSVHFLHQGISPKVLEALVTIAGGEQISEDW